MIENNSAARDNGKYRQFLVAIIVNLLAFSSGITWGWPSPVLPQFRSNEPPFGDGPMSEAIISWIGGLMALGGLSIISFCGVLSERIGRKKFALLSGLPHIVAWLLIIFGQSYVHVYAARIAGGMGAATTVFVVPLYLSEIASEDIRGILGSLLLFFINLGTLFAYVAGAYLSYRLFAWLALIFPLGFVAIFGLMPETPVYLVRRDRGIEARKSLMFLRGNNEALVEQELAKLGSQSKSSDSSAKKVGLSDFLKDTATRKGLIISFGLLAGQQLSGIFAMLSYAEMIFEHSPSAIAPAVASIIIGTMQIFGSYASTMLMDRAGRRILTLVSCVGMTISHCLVGLFFYLQLNKYDVSSISLLPIVALSTYIVAYCLGIGPVPFIVTSEVFRSDVSSSAMTVCYIFYWMISFASIQAFGAAVELLGLDGCFFMLGSFCALCGVFVYCLMPETKGRDRQDIVDELAGIGSRRKERDSEREVVGDNDASVDLLTKSV